MRVVVVGGGIAGVSIGYELAARVSVVLVEQEAQLAQHTTGRSAAQYLQSYGNATVRALTVASRPDFDRIAHDFGTPPLLTPLDLLWVADPESDGALDEVLAEGHLVAPITADEACRRFPLLRRDRITRAALDPSGSDIDVASLHQAYVRGLAQRGGRVVRSAPVTAITGAPGSSGRLLVTAGSEAIEADAVIDAAGAWADLIADLAGVRRIGLEPRRRTLFTTPVDTPLVGWAMVCDAAERFYLKPDGHRMLVSPADETPSEPCDAKPEEIDIARAIDLVNERTTLDIRHVSSAWAGLRSFVADRSPVVGARPDRPEFVFFAAQGGYGIQMAPALARTGAALVLDGRIPADVAELGVTAADLAPTRATLP